MRLCRASLFLALSIGLGWAAPATAQMRGYPPGYPYPYGARYAPPDANLRIDVKPKNAQVYVDGYFAGVVDDFDGVFQRLHLTPGDHDIVIYLQGYQSLREKLYLGANDTKKISGKLEPLPAGAADEPVPLPNGPPPASRPERAPAPRGARRAPPPPIGGPNGEPPDRGGASQVGTAVIHVQPGDSEILIDGERWDAPGQTSGQLVVQLSDGRHMVEIRKSGYRTVQTEIDVRPGATTPLNVSLTPER